MIHKNKILELRAQGKTYNEISKELGCDKSTISYHCGVGRKDKVSARRKKYFEENFLAKKVSRFIRHKARDFQRRSGGKVFGSCEANFKVIDVVNKIGDNPICYLSGEKIDLKETKTYHFDHIIPASRGGLNTLDNLGVLCKQVNHMKSDLTVDEFLSWCQKILEFNGFVVNRRV